MCLSKYDESGNDGCLATHVGTPEKFFRVPGRTWCRRTYLSDPTHQQIFKSLNRRYVGSICTGNSENRFFLHLLRSNHHYISNMGALNPVSCFINYMLQMTHWDMLNEENPNLVALFNMSKCVICLPVWRFVPRDRSAAKGLTWFHSFFRN